MQPFILAVETSSRIGSVAISLGENLLAETKFAGPSRHSAELFPAVCNLLDRFSRKPDQIEHIYISVGPGSFTGIRIAVTLAKTMHLANAAKIVAVDSLDVIASNVINLTPNELPVTNHQSPITHACPERPVVSEPVLSVLVLSGIEGVERVEPSRGDAQRTTHDEKVAAILDAKRNQFFIAVYQKTQQSQIVKQPTGYEKIVPDCVMTSEEFLEKFANPRQPIWLLGDGLLYYKDKFKAAGTRFFDEQYWSPYAEKVHLLGWQKALQNQFTDPLILTPNYLMRPDIKLKSR